MVGGGCVGAGGCGMGCTLARPMPVTGMLQHVVGVPLLGLLVAGRSMWPLWYTHALGSIRCCTYARHVRHVGVVSVSTVVHPPICRACYNPYL